MTVINDLQIVSPFLIVDHCYSWLVLVELTYYWIVKGLRNALGPSPMSATCFFFSCAARELDSLPGTL